MIRTEPKMTPTQMASLLDSAFRHPRPLDFLDAAVMTLRTVGRVQDGTAAAWIGCLLAEGEVEVLMSLYAAWRRGEERSPEETARQAIILDD